MDEQNHRRTEAHLVSSCAGDRAIVRRRELAEAIDFWNLSITGVWMHYVSLGGELTEYELDAYIHEAYLLAPYQHDILAEAVNELIDMLPPPPRAPFSDDRDR
ncbi:MULTISPECIES: hypothetical protein [unclassified Brevibacterium]|uniref:hypothetical protein n=1 Tax=unclassified Brevibacterium TaxID=2614124 RepID=UPI001091D85F|nr:hypothetical protein [Brevibacterium sp. S22]TGD29154.1 hypothetical protein EB835_16605 [Brevibacterium sp. S22]